MIGGDPYRKRPLIFAALAVAATVFVLAATSCTSDDSRASVLQERARWTVQVLGMTQSSDGAVGVSTRLSGPTNSSLSTLTVRFRLTDATEATIGEVWHTFDLGDIERGGPADKYVRIPGIAAEVSGVGVELVPYPDDAEVLHIEELRELGAER